MGKDKYFCIISDQHNLRTPLLYLGCIKELRIIIINDWFVIRQSGVDSKYINIYKKWNMERTTLTQVSIAQPHVCHTVFITMNSDERICKPEEFDFCATACANGSLWVWRPFIGSFSTQRDSNMQNAFMSWCHMLGVHDVFCFRCTPIWKSIIDFETNDYSAIKVI